jgi:hypothetical protein
MSEIATLPGMTDGKEAGAYIVQANRNEPILLCVMDYERGQYHTFRLSVLGAARLASDCAERVHVALGKK